MFYYGDNKNVRIASTITSLLAAGAMVTSLYLTSPKTLFEGVVEGRKIKYQENCPRSHLIVETFESKMEYHAFKGELEIVKMKRDEKIFKEEYTPINVEDKLAILEAQKQFNEYLSLPNIKEVRTCRESIKEEQEKNLEKFVKK